MSTTSRFPEKLGEFFANLIDYSVRYLLPVELERQARKADRFEEISMRYMEQNTSLQAKYKDWKQHSQQDDTPLGSYVYICRFLISPGAELSTEEVDFFAELLQLLSEFLVAMVCNDVNERIVNCLSSEQIDALEYQMHLWNGDPEEHLEDGHFYSPNWFVLRYLIAVLKGSASLPKANKV